MLRDLVVSNFAIIKDLEVSFEDGLNVLTGETGAGKSILIGAVNLLLGSRASQEMIRSGTGEALVEAVFSVSNRPRFIDRMRELGLDEVDKILIRRSINRNGRNRIFVNDCTVSLQQLQYLAEGLISISGQHEHQLLLNPEVHLGLLDSFGALDSRCREVACAYSEWSRTDEALKQLRRHKQDRAAQLDFMTFQFEELKAAGLRPGEDTELEQERNILRHAATLLDAAQSAYQIMYEGKGAILERLAEVEKNAGVLARVDPTQSGLLEELEQERIQLAETARALHRYMGRISFDPQRLAAVEDRLSILQRLGKKYGGTVAALIERFEELGRALAHGEDADLREEEMSRDLERLRQAYLDLAEALSAERRAVADRLSREVERTLAELDMPKARFGVEFERHQKGEAGPAFAENGIDRVEFLLSANPGEEMKPLAKVASGGELSRILLALKSLLSRNDEGETLVFDEVDAGIGGRTAELVGLQLKRLAGSHQVICITHLPQIACYGEHHYRVAKRVTGGETATEIVRLDRDDRIEELARMLGGIRISEKTRAHALEILQKARG